MKKLFMFVAGLMLASAVFVSGAFAAPSTTLQPVPLHKIAVTPVTIINCNGLGLVDPVVMFMYCNTSSLSPGVSYFTPDGKQLSLSTLRNADSAIAGGWASDGSLDGFVDFSAGARLTVTVNVTGLRDKGKGVYVKQLLVPSWNGAQQDAYTVEADAIKGSSSFHVDVPAGATNVYLAFISLVGGSNASISETLVGFPGL